MTPQIIEKLQIAQDLIDNKSFSKAICELKLIDHSSLLESEYGLYCLLLTVS